jgi:hypothetical protein
MFNKAAMECPRWERCSVNNCPLTVEYPDWAVAELDSEKKCTLGKNRRVAIGSKYSELKMGGLTPREFAAKKRMENMSPEELQKLRDRGKNLAGTVNLSVRPESGAPVRQGEV